MIGIYKITSPSNSVYIGQSWDIKKRVQKYQRLHCKGQKYIYNSFLKYGFEAHKIEIIHLLPTDISQEVMNSYEIAYWQSYKDLGIKMLNIREAGTGGRQSEESKKLMSLGHIGKKHSDATKKILSERSKGQKRLLGFRHSEASKLKMSEYQKGRSRPEHIRKLLRVKKSEIGRLNIVEALKDKTIYFFRNDVTHEIFSGIRFEFMKKYSLDSASISRLLSGEYHSTKKWRVFIPGTEYLDLSL